MFPTTCLGAGECKIAAFSAGRRLVVMSDPMKVGRQKKLLTGCQGSFSFGMLLLLFVVVFVSVDHHRRRRDRS